MKVITNYKDTIELMLSDDWKERIQAEYAQLQLRILKIEQWQTEHAKMCPCAGFEMDQMMQYKAMSDYKLMLFNRMLGRRIEVPEVKLPEEQGI